MASGDLLRYLRERPTTQWDDVAGLERAKTRLLESVVMPVKFPHLFSVSRRPQWKGTLLYGVPGSGKSFLAKALASQVGDATFYHVNTYDFLSKFSDGEKMIKELFMTARANTPCIVLIDDIDALCDETYREGEWYRRVVTEFLVQLDSHDTDNTGAHVVATTNSPWILTPGLRRRFMNRIAVTLPESAVRGQMFKQQLGDSAHNLSDDDFKELGRRSDGYTGSDISGIARDAQMQPVRELAAATHFNKVTGPSVKDPTITVDDLLTPCKPGDEGAFEMSWTHVTENKLLSTKISMDTVLQALSKSKPTVTDEYLAKMDEFTREFGPEV